MLPLFALYLLWMSWLVAWLVATVAPLRGVRKLNLPEEILYRIVTLGAGALLFTLTPWPGIDVQYRLWHRAVEDDLAWRLIWTVAGALAIACWALIHHHIAFSRGASIVTAGPYALVRHPIYLCLTVAAFATAAIFGRPSSFMGASVLTLAFLAKVLVEEARTTGPAFASYKRRTLMFVPVLGFAWLGLTLLAQRLRAMLVRDSKALPAPLPDRREPVITPPEPAIAPRVESPAPLSQVRSIALELVLPPEAP